MKALRFDGRRLHLAEVPPRRQSDEALVQVLVAGICNTDLEIVRGYGGFNGTLGHEFVGRVVECGDREWLGRRVVGEINVGCGECALCRSGDSRHCADRTVLGIKSRDGAFAEFLSLPVRNLREAPDSLTNETLVFVEPLAAAARILDQIELTGRTQVGVLGDGKLAQLIARVLVNDGIPTTVIGRHGDKLALAQAAGARTMMVESGPVGDNRDEASIDRLFDVVIEATGSSSGLPLALSLVRPQGTVVLKSTHHGPTTLALSPLVVDEIRLIGSRCGRFDRAIALLKTGAVDVDDLVSAVFRIEDGVAAFGRAEDPGSMKVLMRIAEETETV